MVPGGWPQRAGLWRVAKRSQAPPEAELGPPCLPAPAGHALRAGALREAVGRCWGQGGAGEGGKSVVPTCSGAGVGRARRGRERAGQPHAQRSAPCPTRKRAGANGKQLSAFGATSHPPRRSCCAQGTGTGVLVPEGSLLAACLLFASSVCQC